MPTRKLHKPGSIPPIPAIPSIPNGLLSGKKGFTPRAEPAIDIRSKARRKEDIDKSCQIARMFLNPPVNNTDKYNKMKLYKRYLCIGMDKFTFILFWYLYITIPIVMSILTLTVMATTAVCVYVGKQVYIQDDENKFGSNMTDKKAILIIVVLALLILGFGFGIFHILKHLFTV